MAHFAKVLDSVVTQVIVAEQDFIDSIVDTVPGTWLQVSYNTLGGIHYERNADGTLGSASSDQSKALRKNYPGIGWHYDFEADGFYSSQPFGGWTLNSSTFLWEPPVAVPDDFDGMNYAWDEDTQKWIEVTE